MAEDKAPAAPKADSETASPRGLSEGERVKKSRVVEDIDIFDEVFDGKKESHVEEEIKEVNVKQVIEVETEAEEVKESIYDEEEAKPAEEKKKVDSEEETGEEGEEETEEAVEETREEEAEQNETEAEEPEEDEANNESGKEQEKERKKKAKAMKQIDFKQEELNQKEIKLKKKKAKDAIDEEFEETPSKEEIRETILEKAKLAQTGELNFSKGAEKQGKEDALPLKFLEDKEDNVYIGRKKSLQEKYGNEGALYLGKIREEGYGERKIFMDSLNPHVVFVCGARGSGKSYVLGVIAEEIAKKNKSLGTIVVDPIGVFWSMKFPNKEDLEVQTLPKWDLAPEGLNNLKVFIPEGMKSSTPSNTYDATFSIKPSLLTPEDWCLTFGMERFGPTGLLLDKLLKRVESGYKKTDGKYVKAKKKLYSLKDLVGCLEFDAELNSRERGFKQDSIRALVSRFEAARSWGIFSEKGTPLSELSRENQLTVLDTSFLEENVSALVIGILGRRILAARKLSTRKEAAKKFNDMDVEGLLEGEIPPTWLFIDEAHTLIPGGNVTTPATKALIEYVKQGRRPGCSIVFATQQPSAIDSKVLSQLDILMTHKLVFDDDIKAIFKRIPTIIPHKYKKSNFIRTLPIGTALTGDRREETSRAFVMKVRPRMSQHEGREAEARVERVELTHLQVEKLAMNMLLQKLEKEGSVDMTTVNQVIDTLNSKYTEKVMLSGVLDLLEKRGTKILPDEDKIVVPGMDKPLDPEEVVEEIEAITPEEVPEIKESGTERVMDETELMAFPAKLNEEDARKIANKNRKKRFLGLFGKEERIEEIRLNYQAIWRLEFNEFTSKNEYVLRTCFIDSITGEMIHYKNEEFISSQGFSRLASLEREEIEVLKEMHQKKRMPERLKESEFSKKKLKALLDKLVSRGFLKLEKGDNKLRYALNREIDLPPSSSHSLLVSLNSVPLAQTQAVSREMENFSKDQASKMISGYFPNTVVKKVTELFRPVYEVILLLPDGNKRVIRIGGFTGKVLK